MKKFKLLLAILVLSCAGMIRGQNVDLVKNGKVMSEIVIADRPTLDAQFGARELQYHIRLITGQTVPIRKASEKRSQPTALVVGDSALSRKLGFKKENYRGEEYEIRFLPDHIVIAGSERADYRKMDPKDFRALPRTFEPDHGVLWGVYDFLERCCSVRWYGPGEVGITYTPGKSLSVKKAGVRRAPSMGAFRNIYTASSKNLYAGQVSLSKEDMSIFALRWRQITRYGSANHNLSSIYLAHWKESPVPRYRAKQQFKGHRKDFFARGYEGKADRYLNSSAKYFPNDPDLPPQLCKTHPEVFQFFAREAADGLKGKFAFGAYCGYLRTTCKNPDIPFYYPVEDDDNHAVCQCSRCSKIFADKGEKRLSYIHFNFAANIAREAAELDPRANISTLAYGLHQHYPHGLDMPANLGVEMVLHCANYFHRAYREREMKIFHDWTEDSAKGKRLVTIWAHYLVPCWEARHVYKYNNFFPVFFYREIGKFLKLCVRRKVSGFFVENPLEIGYSLPTTQLELYMTMMLAFDGSKDVDQLADEFFPRWYGEAGKPMKQFYETVRTASQDLKNYPAEYSDPDYFSKHKFTHSFFPESVNWGMLGTRERMNQLEKYVNEARKLVKTPMEKLRFEIFLKGLWEPMKQGRSAYEQKLKFRKRPIPSLTVPRVAPAHGDVKAVDWKKAARIEQFRTLHGFPGPNTRKMEIAHDGTCLYLRYSEKCKTAELKSTKKIWDGDDIEIFFAAERAKPYVQFAVSPAGKVFSQGYFMTADAVSNRKWDFKEKLQVQSAPDSLVLCCAFPLERLLPDKSLQSGMSFYMNIFRSSPGKIGKLPHCWSPTFTSGFHEMERLGKITLAK